MNRTVLMACVVFILGALCPAWGGPRPAVRIGMLLMAIDAGRDHVRISEAFRVTHTAGPTRVRVNIALPEQAQYVTIHRGVESSEGTDAGFTGIIPLRGGITEVAYSYAMPTGAREVLSRVFPFDIDRMEIVAKGGQVRLAVMRGRELSPVVIGTEALPRWEIRSVRAGDPVVIGLTGLPVTVRWWPYAAAAILAGILMMSLLKGVNSAPKKS